MWDGEPAPPSPLPTLSVADRPTATDPSLAPPAASGRSRRRAMPRPAAGRPRNGSRNRSHAARQWKPEQTDCRSRDLIDALRHWWNRRGTTMNTRLLNIAVIAAVIGVIAAANWATEEAPEEPPVVTVVDAPAVPDQVEAPTSTSIVEATPTPPPSASVTEPTPPTATVTEPASTPAPTTEATVEVTAAPEAATIETAATESAPAATTESVATGVSVPEATPTSTTSPTPIPSSGDKKVVAKSSVGGKPKPAPLQEIIGGVPYNSNGPLDLDSDHARKRYQELNRLMATRAIRPVKSADKGAAQIAVQKSATSQALVVPTPPSQGSNNSLIYLDSAYQQTVPHSK